MSVDVHENQIFTFIQMLYRHSSYSYREPFACCLEKGNLYSIMSLLLLLVAWYMRLLVDRYVIVGG